MQLKTFMDYAFPAPANALYENRYPLSTAPAPTKLSGGGS